MKLVYDGECPVCRTYVQMLRLREAAGQVELVDARAAPALVSELRGRGFEINEGIVLIAGDQYFYGADAMNAVALMTTPARWANRLNYFMFRSRRFSRFAYPALRTGRNLVLRLLGRSQIA